MSKELDPIIAAVAEHRKAYAEYARVAEDVPLSTDGHDHEQVTDAAFDKKEAAAFALAMSEPASLAGAIALLDYANENSERAFELAATPVPDGFADGVRDWSHLMNKSLAKGLRRIAAGNRGGGRSEAEAPVRPPGGSLAYRLRVRPSDDPAAGRGFPLCTASRRHRWQARPRAGAHTRKQPDDPVEIEFAPPRRASAFG